MSVDDDLVVALAPVVEAFQAMDVPYFVGGSVASSYHGAMRSTMDVDIVADLGFEHVDQLLEKTKGDFYVSESAIRDSIRSRSCFNLIHLPTSFKVDVFVSRRRAFDQSAMQRAQIATLRNQDQFHLGIEVPIATREDIILAKLDWFRLGDETSERQWDDLSRMIMVNRPSLDWNYLQHHATELAIDDLLERLKSQ